jgi:peptidoglycan LD-endopeptidase CwlK
LGSPEEGFSISKGGGRMPSRLIRDMDERLQLKFVIFSAKMAEADLPFILTCTLRTQLEQDALFAQGRKSLSYVNGLRKITGLSPITELDNKKEVTWVKISRHTPPVGQSKSLAFDIAVCSHGLPVWDVKADTNSNTIPDYIEAANIGRKLGLRCGADFTKKDWVHFELAT